MKQCPNSFGLVLLESFVKLCASLQCNKRLFTPCSISDSLPVKAISTDGDAEKTKCVLLIIDFFSRGD